MSGTDEMPRVAGGPSRITVQVSGRLDLTTTPALRATLAPALARQPGELIVDCRGVTDVVGLIALAPFVHAARSLRAAGGQLRIAAPPPVLLTAIRAARLDRVLPVGEWSSTAVIDLTGEPARAGRAGAS